MLIASADSLLTTRVLSEEIDVTATGVPFSKATSSAIIFVTAEAAKVTGRLIGFDPIANPNHVVIAFAQTVTRDLGWRAGME